MWAESAVNQDDTWGWGSGLLENLHQSGDSDPPNCGLLPPDDELPVDVKQEEYTEHSMVTDLFLDSDADDEDPSPGYEGSHKHTTESSTDVTEGHGEQGSTESEQLYLETKDEDITNSIDVLEPPLLGHVGGKPFHCKECGKGVSQSCNWKIHMQMHTEEKPFICKECEVGFSHSGNLKKHMGTLTGEKPFTCQECGVGFSRSGSLESHMRTHTGEKPVICKECGVGFSQSCHMKLHMRTHTGEKPYTCQECGVGFSHSGDLEKHMRTHTVEKAFTCKECGVGFSQPGDLKRYMAEA